MKTFKAISRASVSVVAALVLAFSPAHAALPVVDAALNAQTALFAWFNEFKTYATQLLQYTTQIKTLATATTARELGNVLDSPALKGMIPADFKQVLDSMKANGFAGMTYEAQILRANDAVFDCNTFMNIGLNPSDAADLRKRCEAELGKVSQNKAYGKKAFELASQRVQQIGSLQIRAGLSKDAKEISELQARIGGENAQLQTEAMQGQLYRFMAEQDDRQRVQAAAERTTKAALESRSTSWFTAGLAPMKF